ncbi:MAG: hypothetical protein ACRDRH_04440 [Pseudonocardia sp.]
MRDEDDLDLTDLAQRRWVRYELPVLVCVDTAESGDQHVVPVLDDIDMAADDLRAPVVYGPDGTKRKALGLAYAALDFGIEADTGRVAFYESNSSGQDGWLEAQTGAPITAALADLLAGACS